MDESVQEQQSPMSAPQSQIFHMSRSYFLLVGILAVGLYIGLIIGRNNSKTNQTAKTIITTVVPSEADIPKDKDGWQRTEFKSAYTTKDDPHGKFSLSYPSAYCRVIYPPTITQGKSSDFDWKSIECQKGTGSFTFNPEALGRGANSIFKVDENVPLGNYQWTRIDFGGVTYGMRIGNVDYLMEIEYKNSSQELRALAEEIIATFNPIK